MRYGTLMMIRQIGSQALQLLMPNYCLLCKAFDFNGDDPWICPACEDLLPKLKPPFCFTCGHPSKNDCPHCKQTKNAFACHRSIGIYRAEMRTLIHQFKYSGRRNLLNLWQRLIEQNGQARLLIESTNAICAVPTTGLRTRLRGFNQAALLADRIGKRWQKPVWHNVLQKAHHATPQTRLLKHQRMQCARQTFILHKSKPEPVHTLLLIDDVMTTGATMNACAEVIKQSGLATRVWALTLARTEIRY